MYNETDIIDKCHLQTTCLPFYIRFTSVKINHFLVIIANEVSFKGTHKNVKKKTNYDYYDYYKAAIYEFRPFYCLKVKKKDFQTFRMIQLDQSGSVHHNEERFWKFERSSL